MLSNTARKGAHFMKKWLFVLCFYLGSSSQVHAYITKPISQIKQPPVEIVVPRGFISHRHDNDKIYMPDKYHCYIKKTLRYCTTNHGRPINGYIVRAYDNEYAYEFYQNGYQNGTTSVYSSDGNLLRRSEYKKGLKNGVETVYFFNGNTHFIMHYSDGLLDGRIEQYDISGVLLGKFNYKKGRLRDGYCNNEAKGHSMQERLQEKEYNKFIPCGETSEN